MKSIKTIENTEYFNEYAEYFDDKITVYYNYNTGIYFVSDLKEQIYFECTAETLLNRTFTYYDDVYFDKINAQNHMELENKNDSYYIIHCITEELERILNHCKYFYHEFGAESFYREFLKKTMSAEKYEMYLEENPF
jgi:hypothetical protein